MFKAQVIMLQQMYCTHYINTVKLFRSFKPTDAVQALVHLGSPSLRSWLKNWATSCQQFGNFDMNNSRNLLLFVLTPRRRDAISSWSAGSKGTRSEPESQTAWKAWKTLNPRIVSRNNFTSVCVSLNSGKVLLCVRMDGQNCQLFLNFLPKFWPKWHK